MSALHIRGRRVLKFLARKCRLAVIPLLLSAVSAFTQSPAQATAKLAAEPTATAAPSQGTSQSNLANKDAKVVVLGYHRFEEHPKDGLAIQPEVFREQMQELKNTGISVISMTDFLAWRKGNKAIPQKSALITIDDGYVSGYNRAWPILKEFGYPFTMYIYTKYVDVGGKSITWDQLSEMRDANVEFGSHSHSHDNMVRPRTLKGGNYEEWLTNELFGSKKTIESKLNTKVVTFAFPYGKLNANIVQDALKGGYEAMFTVNPIPVGFNSPTGSLGRFVIDSTHPNTFKKAIGTLTHSYSSTSPGMEAAAPTVPIVTEPTNDQTINNPLPEIKANLATLGNIQPNSVRLAISGFGPVSATYDPQSKMLSYKLTRPLREKTITVFLSVKNESGTVGTTWTFHYAPNAAPAASSTASPSPTTSESPPTPETK